MMKDHDELFEKTRSYLRQEGAKRIGVFGSYFRGEETSSSDLDIIVDFIEKKSLLELIRLERELSEKLGIKVDLLTEKSISPYLREKIKNETMVIYSA